MDTVLCSLSFSLSSHKQHTAYTQKCGSIVNWKRVQDATGTLQGATTPPAHILALNVSSFIAFGYCEHADPECTLRAMRLLNDLELGDKCLKVSALLSFSCSVLTLLLQVKVDRQNKKELLKSLAKKKLREARPTCYR